MSLQPGATEKTELLNCVLNIPNSTVLLVWCLTRSFAGVEADGVDKPLVPAYVPVEQAEPLTSEAFLV